MKNLRVVGVENKGGDIEEFTLLNEEDNECFIILDSVKQRDTFEYLMDCFRDRTTVEREKLFVKKLYANGLQDEFKDIEEGEMKEVRQLAKEGKIGFELDSEEVKV